MIFDSRFLLSFPVLCTVRVKGSALQCTKKGVRSRKIFLPPLADIVSTYIERQRFRK